jgi:hypothetical protein
MVGLLVVVGLACTGEEADSADSAVVEDSAPPTGPGTLAISVKMSSDMVDDLTEDGESANAMVSGSVFAEADVEDSSGPGEGAVSLGDFSAMVDLTAGGGPSEVIYTTELLEPQIVYVLGCMDSDANGECGDEGDPVTMPPTNKAQIAAEAETPFTMVLGLRRP